MIKRLIAAYRAAKKQERTISAYNKLVNHKLDYIILQEIADSVSTRDIVIRVTLTDGTRIDTFTNHETRANKMRDKMNAESEQMADMIAGMERNMFPGAR